MKTKMVKRLILVVSALLIALFVYHFLDSKEKKLLGEVVLIDSTIYGSFNPLDNISYLLSVDGDKQGRVLLPGVVYNQGKQAKQYLWLAGSDGFKKYNMENGKIETIDYGGVCANNPYPNTNSMAVIGDTPFIWQNLGAINYDGENNDFTFYYGLSKGNECYCYPNVGDSAINDDGVKVYGLLLIKESSLSNSKELINHLKLVIHTSSEEVMEKDIEMPFLISEIDSILVDGEYMYGLFREGKSIRTEDSIYVDQGMHSIIARFTIEGELIDYKRIDKIELISRNPNFYINNNKIVILNKEIIEYNLKTFEEMGRYQWNSPSGEYEGYFFPTYIGSEFITICDNNYCYQYDKNSYEVVDTIAINELKFKHDLKNIIAIEDY